MRDAIVYGRDWTRGAGALGRLAVAIARAGGKVLHGSAAISVLARPDGLLRKIEPNLFTFHPWVYSHRLNRLPGMPRFQAEALARQLLVQARALGLENPFFVYEYLGRLLVPLGEAMRRQGCRLVFAPMNYTESLGDSHVEQSDLTLVFSRTLYYRMRARWAERVRYGFLGIDLLPFRGLCPSPENPPAALAAIPRPRLGYAGAYGDEFLNTRVLGELLRRQPWWNFASFEAPRVSAAASKRAVPLPNAHLLPWQDPKGFARCVASFDVGFMPYDCSSVVLLNNPPLKLWDYFALGLPVVATPLIHLWPYDGLVRFGETAKELERAVEEALAEPLDSPLRQQRRAEAEKHSIEAMGRLLEQILG